MIHSQYGLVEFKISPEESSPLRPHSSTNKTHTNEANFHDVTAQSRNEIVWMNVIIFSFLHLSAVHGLYLVVFQKKYILLMLACVLCTTHAQGITAGAHRLWSHRSYKVTLPLKLFLVYLQTASFQNSIFVWARDHRLHHKYTDTNADPHNSKRGFFFSHMGWLFIRKHPDVIRKGKTIDMSDITSDSVLMWQHRNYYLLMIFAAFIIPVYIAHYLTGEHLSNCFAICGALRYIYSVHVTWLVNSAAHFFGTKPYDRNIAPSENLIVSHLTLGEGFHNFHHVFPWDYKASELGHYTFNFTLFVINSFAKIGWAYDMKTVSDELVRKRVLRTGDGTQDYRKMKWTLAWGWNDPNLPSEHRDLADVNGKKM